MNAYWYGAHVNLNEIADDFEESVKESGCDDILEYLKHWGSPQLESLFNEIRNYGIEHNPKFCGVPICKHLPNESNKSMIVRVVEAFTRVVYHGSRVLSTFDSFQY